VKKKRFFLKLTLKEEIVEGRPEYTLFSHRSRTSLLEVLEILRRASSQPRIVALLLTVDELLCGWGRLATLRRALHAFRSSGKSIYCFLESGGNCEYYLASVCDQIFMAPAAGLQIVGLAVETFFFRELLDRFGVEPQIHTVGEYKSAAEIFTRSDMSPQAREQWGALLDDHFEIFCSAIAEGRGLEKEEVSALIDSGPFSVREAVRRRLLDGACYQDEVEEKLKDKFGRSLKPYPAFKIPRSEGILRRLLTFRRPKIALLDVVGTIDSGESRRDRAGRQVAGSETIGKFLDHARESDAIRAVVLRVDSPGGSALASDLLWRKISLLREKKPVVASFGDVAASGGYYLAVASSHIVAEPTSITGSIGVIGGKLVAQDLTRRLAIRRESIRRGAHAEYESLFSPFSQQEAANLQGQLLEFYREDFLKKVAQGRRMEEEAVDAVGRGRVWSGRRALAHGLLDEIGGLSDAIQQARRLALIPERKKIRLLHYYRRRKLRELLAPDLSLSGSAQLRALSGLDRLEFLLRLSKHNLLLWLPFDVRIR
jgi:protease-4